MILNAIDLVEPTIKWTEIVSSLSAAIGVPFVIFSIFKLFKKDKKRDSEIESLSTIAAKLTDIQKEATIRYRASKKPYITIQLEEAPKGQRIKLNFTNSNRNGSIMKFAVKNERIDFANVNLSSTSINDDNGQQIFSIILNGKNKPIEFFPLNIDYITEEGYRFIQQIIIWRDGGKYVYSPSVIADENYSDSD